MGTHNYKQMLEHRELYRTETGSADYFSIQKSLIQERKLLKYCYDLWYKKLIEDEKSVPNSNQGKLLELGSGGSYLKEYLPHLITSDLEEGVAEEVIDARSLPFSDNSLRGIFMTHVFHHIPNIIKFFEEADRTLNYGGVISLIEVAKTPLAQLLFSKFHPEPYLPNENSWTYEQSDSMIDTNQALSWIVFKLDRNKFYKIFPNFRIEVIEYLPTWSYLFSGGVTKKDVVPIFLHKYIILMDNLLKPMLPLTSLHWHIRIRKI